MNDKSKKLAIKLSEIRSALIELGASEAEGDEEKRDALTVELGETETAYRAAMAEPEPTPEARRNGDDGESAELRALVRDVNFRDYLTAAANGRALEGRARELNQALKAPEMGSSGGALIPWRALVEERAFSTTSAYDGATVQRPILQELFGPGVFDALGVRVDDAGVGSTEYPLLSGNVAPVQKEEPDAADAATAAGFTVATLKPKRLTAELEFTHEMAASVAGLESAFRQNLMDALKSKMSDLILTGAAPSNANPQHVQGFVSRLGAATELSNAEAEAGDYGRLHSLGVDGIHASMETEVGSVVGDETYQHAAGVYITGSGESGSELLKRRSGGCVASTYIPAISATKQFAILHAAGPQGGAMRGDSVAAMWGGGVEIIRDPYTQASVGVVLTAVALWDAHTALRSDAYQKIAIQVS